MVENEQLGKELGYHIRQTELLLQKNEKLVHENIDLHRKVLLAKEVQEDLAHRNRMNQKTIRILLYKLRERHNAMKADKHADEEETKEFLCQQEQQPFSQISDKTVLHHLKGGIQEGRTSTAGEMLSSAEEAMKFLYTCLQDIETEKINNIIYNISKDQQASRLETDLRLAKPCLPSSLDGLNSQERQEVLMHLLRTAVSLRALCQNTANSSQPEGLGCSVSNDKAAVSVDDILKLPVETLCVNEIVFSKLQNHVKSVSSGAQTESKGLEECSSLEMKQQLRLCGSVGTGV